MSDYAKKYAPYTSSPMGTRTIYVNVLITQTPDTSGVRGFLFRAFFHKTLGSVDTNCYGMINKKSG
ncbi:hypothetical protein PSKAS_00470 [Peribacillus sp. N1]